MTVEIDKLRTAFATLTRRALDGPREVVESVASVVYWLVVLVAVLVAHTGLAAVAVRLVGPAWVWVYGVAFLVFALGPLTVVAARLYVTLDPAAEAIADGVVDETGDDRSASDDDRSAS